MDVNWTRDWLLGGPMMLATVTFHIAGLCAIEWSLRWFNRDRMGDRSFGHFLVLMAIAADVALTLHVIEGFAWAGLYLWLGAVPNFGSAILYSMNALTSYGHERLELVDNWQLLGPIQSMAGMIAFGLTTAFIFGAMVLIRPQGHHWVRD